MCNQGLKLPHFYQFLYRGLLKIGFLMKICNFQEAPLIKPTQKMIEPTIFNPPLKYIISYE